MEPDSYDEEIPQKIFRSNLIQNVHQSFMHTSSSENESANKMFLTPADKITATLITPSPTGSMRKLYCNTPGSLRKTPRSSLRNTPKNSMNLFPILHTPPNRNIPRVVNPFEQHLAERLHLPLICSPSLFQRPSTPQLCSTQFEWTIEELSSLGPANVEPHETQFHDSLDPDTEAKTQAAITSYFKTNIIVPSPSGSFQNQSKPKLLDESFVKIIKRVRDGCAQTVLTLPPILPQELEDALRPYMKFNVDQQQSPALPADYYEKQINKSQIIDYEARDASLRRKLFDMPFNFNHDDTINGACDEFLATECEALSPPPKSPEMEASSTNSNLFDRNSVNKTLFGCLSPISKESEESQILLKRKNSNYVLNSPKHVISKMNNSNKSIFGSSPDLSPIKSSTTTENENTTPQSIINLPLANDSKQNTEMLVDNSFNSRISRLMVTSIANKSDMNLSASYLQENDYIEDFDMQISQHSNKSSNNSSISEQTPKSKRRSANRKNLSHSFSIYSDDDDDTHTKPLGKLCSSNGNNENNANIINNENDAIKLAVESTKNNFQRMDSGFNETDNVPDYLIQKNKILDDDNDVSMACCSSTPSRKKSNDQNKFVF